MYKAFDRAKIISSTECYFISTVCDMFCVTGLLKYSAHFIVKNI